MVARDGAVTQLVPFDTVAWHAGKSSYGGRDGLNNYSIGIEIDNAGLLTKTEGGYQAWFGKDYPASEVIQAVHRNEKTLRYWHAYTAEQIEAVKNLCRLIMEHYPIKLILGHEEISPGRKVDLGPAFPLDKLRDKLLSAGRDSDEPAEKALPETGIVSVDNLNIRTAPNASAQLAALPFKRIAR